MIRSLKVIRKQLTGGVSSRVDLSSAQWAAQFAHIRDKHGPVRPVPLLAALGATRNPDASYISSDNDAYNQHMNHHQKTKQKMYMQRIKEAGKKAASSPLARPHKESKLSNPRKQRTRVTKVDHTEPDTDHYHNYGNGLFNSKHGGY